MNQPQNKRPPKHALNFFRWFCHPDFVEDIEGDLIEKHERNQQQFGNNKASRKFLWEIITLFRPSLMRPLLNRNHLIHPAMFQQNLKIGYRNLLKNKSYSALKIGGFAIGIAAFLLILMFVQHELSYDQHYAQGDRVHRLLNVSTDPELQFKKWTSMSAQIHQLLNEDYPEIETAGRMIAREWFLAGNNQVRIDGEKQNNYEDGFIYADPEMLDILEMPMVYGTREEALAQPFTLVMSKEKAQKYFPNEDPVGKTIFLNENKDEPYTIGGVVDMPQTSHLSFNYMLTLKGVEFWNGEQTDWCCQNYDAYVRVKPGTDIAQLEEKFLAIKEDYMVQYLLKNENPFAEVMQKHFSFELQPIGDIYLRSKGYFDNYRHSDIGVVNLFTTIAIFILLLACINFINLFTAKSANRAKEVGVRKVVGSFKSDLIRQFLTESTLYSAISVALGVALATFALPYFNELAGKVLVFPEPTLLVTGLILLTIFIGILAGTYPSFYLSSFKPISVLKGNLSRGSKNSNLRSGMVIFQFTTSIVLVVSAFVVYNQMDFILTKKVGFDKEKMLMIKGAFTLREQTDAFKEELLRLPMVENVTNANSFPVDGTSRNNNSFYIEGRQKLDEGVGGQVWYVSPNYVEAMNMNLLEGRIFSKDIAGDSASVIINQTMAKKLGLENPIGQQIRTFRTWNIVGIVEDFHFENMKHEIRPIALFRGSGSASIVVAKIKSDELSNALTAVTGVWDKFMPNQPIRYTFMDEDYAGMYEDVKRTGNVFTTCAGLAILIACLGLFGLSTFMAEQRSKEISVRKILGASTSSLFQLLTANYLKLVFVSLLIGTPIAWYLMDNWLQGYIYRIDLTWWFFAVAGALVAGIALLTVSQQALKLTFSNPAKFLKSE